MASSSSSRKQKYDYEVFLSFSGIDTRQSFLSHLLRRLDDEHIITFKDDKMERGKEIAPALVEGIESSKIAVVILSKHYASSRWCLDELVKILECQEKNGLLVLPIFLDVDPSDARKPRNGTFAVDFARHEKNFNNEQMTTWVAAMTEVANLSGYPLGNGSESELVDKIRDVILQNLEPIPFIDPNKYVGIESHIRKLKSLMDGDTQRIIGIAGMGGVGKTTIASLIFHLIRSDFESSIFLCVADVLRIQGLTGLTKEFLSGLLRKKVRIRSPFVRDSPYARWLCHKKILVVLDDVNNSEEIENLIGQIGSFVFGLGSKIIATSRNKQLLRSICSNGDNSIYEVRGLYDSGALKLFCLHAFKQNYPEEDFRDIVWPILGYADGNPLALKVLGSSLFRKPKSVWEDVLNGLSKCQKQGIHNVLRISYDGLDKMEKKVFLRIACLFYVGDKTSRVIALLDSCGLQTTSGLEVLRDKCLLDFFSPYEDWRYVMMHSLLREMGREIVGEEPDDPGKRSRLWDSCDIYQVFNKNSRTERRPSGVLESTGRSIMASSSSSRKRKYDVFLSFRGEETRPNILSHLRRRLDDEKIDTFKDDTEMERGEEIGPSLLEAIESATIALIILSERYASSKWCLDELVKIMECRKNGELRVIPIFYKVDPSDCRNPTTGIFGKDFSEHEKKFKEKAKLWRTAMAQVADLSGHHLKNFRPEAELLDEVIADVWKKLKPTQPVCTNIFVGIDSQIEEVKRLLSIDKPDQMVIGIVGMGGIGKTTIARVTAEQIFREFDCTSFLCVEENPRELLARLLSELLNETVTISRSFVGGFCPTILTKLCRKKVLIVLDDVNNSKQLEDLIGQNGSSVFGAGSRIIVTSRDKQLLRTICSNGDNSIYKVRGLYDSDALKLFSLHAFKQNHPLEEFRDTVWPIFRYADGNPLALKVLGFSLFRKPKSVWEDVLNGLSKCQKQGIHNVLRISYDGLDKMEKKIFLHIACLFVDEDESKVIALLDSCGFQTRSGLDILRDKCLIDATWYVGMHSLLREMGREIVGEESDNPGKRSRLWDNSDIYQVFNKNSGTEAIEGIKLDYGSDVYLKSDAFKKMPNLKFLIFRRPRTVHCPLGLEYLPDELRLLEWPCCPLKRLPINFQPTNLVDLCLEGARELEQLWEGIQDLSKLKKISLSFCDCLIKLPDLSLAPNLVKVDLTYCSSLVEIPSSMNHLNKLQELCLHGCTNIRSLPSPLAWRSLERLVLDGCSKLTSFPEIECLDALKELSMSNCDTLESLPSSIWKLKSLEKLRLEGCSNLENLWTSTESPQSSRSQLHTNGQFSPLKLLSIRGCEKIRLLPELSGTLLKYLDAASCTSLETAPFDLEQLFRFPNFESCDNSMYFSNCRKLDVHWSKIAALAKMKMQAEAVYSYFEGWGYGFKMIYPGCEIPKWIKYQNMGHSITIQLPVNRRFLGFALSAVVPTGDCFKFDLCFKNTSGDSFSWDTLDYYSFSLEELGDSWGSEHVILCCTTFGTGEYNEMVEKLGRGGDYYDVTSTIRYDEVPYCTCNIKRPDVLKCGLVPLYAQNVNYKGLETPLDESETTKVAINLTEDEIEVSVDGCQVKYPDWETALETYKDASTEILEVDPLTLSAFCVGTLHCVWGNERCKESAVGTLYSPNEKCSFCTFFDESIDEDEPQGFFQGTDFRVQPNPAQAFNQQQQEFFQGMDFRAQPNPAHAFNQQQQVDLCTELQLRPCWLK